MAPACPTPPATPRLQLREFVPDDAPFIVALLNDPDWLRHIGDRDVRTPERARAWLRDGPLAAQQRHGFALWAVCRRGDSAPLGMCGLVRRDGLDHPDLGYAFLPAGRGQGLAREAAAATLMHAFGALKLARVLAITGPDNLPSQRVLQAIGMRFERRLIVPGHTLESLLYAAQSPA
jgi:RimJ/RimL family protein N-acetyltransferase